MSTVINQEIGSVIKEYDSLSRQTDQFKEDDLMPILQGLFGEVGSLFGDREKVLSGRSSIHHV